MRVQYSNGLPQLFIPLPSRREVCQFTLRPISNSVGDLLQGIQTEDQGVDRVAVYTAGELAAGHTDRGPGRRPRRRLRRRSAACNSQSDDWRELLNCRVLLPLQLQCRPYAVYYLSQYYY